MWRPMAAMMLAAMLTGCLRQSVPEQPPVTVVDVVEATTAEQAVAAAEETELYVSDQPPTEPLEQPVAVDLGALVWTPDVGPQTVPARPVAGRLRERSFICRHACVMPAVEEKVPVYRLRLSSRPRGERCGFSLDDDSVSLVWHVPQGEGEWTKRMTEPRPTGADAWYVLEQADGAPLTQHAEFGCYLKIEALLPPTEAGGAPSLRGKLALMFGDEAKSFVAGNFVADGCR